MGDTEETVMICALANSPAPSQVPGSTQLEGDCGHRVWMAPSGQKFYAENPGARVSCMPCAQEAMQKASNIEDVKVLPPTPDQLNELDEYGNEGARLAVNDLFAKIREQWSKKD